MSNNNQNNKYHSEHERRCQGCAKTIKTKEGILESGYFACVFCHNWYKKFEAILITLVILLAILAAWLASLEIWWLTKLVFQETGLVFLVCLLSSTILPLLIYWYLKKQSLPASPNRTLLKELARRIKAKKIHFDPEGLLTSAELNDRYCLELEVITRTEKEEQKNSKI